MCPHVPDPELQIQAIQPQQMKGKFEISEKSIDDYLDENSDAYQELLSLVKYIKYIIFSFTVLLTFYNMQS